MIRNQLLADAFVKVFSSEIKGLKAENVKGIDFLADLYSVTQHMFKGYEPLNINGGCFEGTYQIHRLCGATTFSGDFGNTKLAGVIETDLPSIIEIFREDQHITVQFRPHSLENYFMHLMEVFRSVKPLAPKGELNTSLNYEMLSTTPSLVKDKGNGLELICVGGMVSVGVDAVVDYQDINIGDGVIYNTILKKWEKYDI